MEPVQAPQTTTQIPGKRRRKKLKARHLSELTKHLIIERFKAVQDHQEVADQMELPGLSARTVAAVIDADLLISRKPPQQQQQVVAITRRQTA
jgi:hypothetical protein